MCLLREGFPTVWVVSVPGSNGNWMIYNKTGPKEGQRDSYRIKRTDKEKRDTLLIYKQKVLRPEVDEIRTKGMNGREIKLHIRE